MRFDQATILEISLPMIWCISSPIPAFGLDNVVQGGLTIIVMIHADGFEEVLNAMIMMEHYVEIRYDDFHVLDSKPHLRSMVTYAGRRQLDSAALASEICNQSPLRRLR